MVQSYTDNRRKVIVWYYIVNIFKNIFLYYFFNIKTLMICYLETRLKPRSFKFCFQIVLMNWF